MEIVDELELNLREAASDAVLERNLVVMRARDAALAARIAEASIEPLEIEVAEDGHPTGVWRGRRLASARRPAEEVARMLEGLDLRSTGLVAIAGFGLGHHVAAVARRMRQAGIVLVLETDVALLRAVLSRIDLSSWYAAANVQIVTDPVPSEVSARVRGNESLLMIGIRLIEHPPSRLRLGEASGAFASAVREVATNARMSLATTLIRCATTIENQLGNLPLYATGSGVEDLRDTARGRLGVVVSAGPSLRRNIDLLAGPGVRDRCVIVATQTTLRPLLAAGVAPHLVTAIDYHAISRRFYDGITAEMVQDTELVIDSKVNPVVVDAWPGRIRVIPSGELDRVLGPLARGAKGVPASATVAHLCYSLARHIGCDPVALVGQDLGFTDGLYYAPGNAIHDLWTPEFNAFNTIETMEWERIVRHRGILSAREDVHGRRIFTDAQMLTYLQRFELMFADDEARGLRTIDASEGGVRKVRTEVLGLAETIARHAHADTPPITLPRASTPDVSRIDAVVDRISELIDDVAAVAEASAEAGRILARMIVDQHDRPRMDRHFKRLDQVRSAVEARPDARGLTDLVNQIGVFKRLRADRDITLESDLEPMRRQRLEIERDIVNVEWTGDASRLLRDMLEATRDHLRTGRRRDSLRTGADVEREAGLAGDREEDLRIFAVVPLDPDRGGTGIPRRLDAPLAGSRLLQRTLERLGVSKELAGIILLAPDDLDVGALVDLGSIGLPVTVHRCGRSVFPPSHEAIRAARAATPSSWRGGIHGLTVFDEVLAAAPSLAALTVVEGDAAVLVGPDWPMLPVLGDHGVDAVIRRWRDRPDHPFVFVQAPPGLATFLAPKRMLESYATMPTRRASVGHLLGYRPERPQGDPVATEQCVVPPATIRNAIGRFIVDSPRQRMRIRRCLEDLLQDPNQEPETRELVERLESRMFGTPLMAPQFTRIELCTGRSGVPRSMPFASEVQRSPMNEATFRRIVSELGETGDAVVTFDGYGDPLLHPRFDDFARIAIESGIRLVRIRTDLAVDPSIVDRLLAAPIDVVEVDLDAEHADTHHRMHGGYWFERVNENLERLIAGRRVLESSMPIPRELPAEIRLALPWIIPRIQRRDETIDEIPEFFERWRRRLGCAVIDGRIRWRRDLGDPLDRLSPTQPPVRADRLVAATRMTILSDGTVPISETDPLGDDLIGRVGDRPLRDLWRQVVEERRELDVETGAPPAPMRA
ncbi:MAG: hypothetical protein RLZZ461_1276 [Planctomycetota bacterium]|jgi:hypothetical protein